MAPPPQVADKAWELIREEGAVIEEALKDGRSHSSLEKVDEGNEGREEAADAVVGTSFNEKSDGLHEYKADSVDIQPDEHSPDEEDGQGLS